MRASVYGYILSINISMNAKKRERRGAVHISCNLRRYVVAFLYE